MDNIKFSIIIPMYNIEDYIERCINSILIQEYTNYEIIIVNDGSTDKSREIIQQYESNKQIHIIDKENGGLSDARNIGLKHVTGEYIWFVDGDDYIEANALKSLYNILQKHSYNIIVFTYNKIFKSSKKAIKLNINTNNDKQKILSIPSACSKVFNSKFFLSNKYQFIKGKIYEDLELIPFILSQTKNIYFLNIPLYNYVFRNNSIMNIRNVFNTNRDDKFWAIDSLYKKFGNANLLSEYKEELEYLAINHLALSYTSEILLFSKKHYLNRCYKVLEYLNNINPNWMQNKYLNQSALTTKQYLKLLYNKHFYICKLIIVIAKSIGRL